MIIRPILFNTEMVQAIQEGRKTVTRRLAKDLSRPPYETGDMLWVRETWNFLPCITCMERDCSLTPEVYEDAESITEGCFLYKALYWESPVFGNGHSWRPSIHMPTQAARIFLQVKEVRSERLQEIDGAGLLKEGIDRALLFNGPVRFAFDAFQKLWDSTIPKDKLETAGWAADPMVWVIRFRECEKPEGWPWRGEAAE